MTETGTKYVLQVLDGTVEDGERELWLDVTTVSVAARTKHATAIRQAAKDAGVEPPAKVRLLPWPVAEPTELLPPEPEPGPKQLRL